MTTRLNAALVELLGAIAQEEAQEGDQPHFGVCGGDLVTSEGELLGRLEVRVTGGLAKSVGELARHARQQWLGSEA